LTITPKQQHLGKIRQGEIRPFTFTVTNTSPKTVEIVGVKASCGCTEVELSEKLLAPGASGTVTGKLSAEGRLGNFGSTLRFETLAGDFQETTVRGQAVAPLVGPTHLDLGETYLGEQAAVKTFTYSSGDDELEWDTLKVKAEGLKASVEGKGDRWHVSLQPVHEPVVGTFQGTVMIECWNAGNPEPVGLLSAIVQWKTQSRIIRISPTLAFFGVMKEGEVKTLRLTVKNMSGGSIRLNKVESPDGLEVKARLIEDLNQELYLEIEAKGKRSRGGVVSEFIRMQFAAASQTQWHQLMVFSKNER
jgi:hypothetical protein